MADEQQAQTEVTEEEIREEIKEEAPPVAERPEHIPEKFWNTEKGEADYEEMGKSYKQLETYVGGKKEELKETILEELVKEQDELIPEEYKIPALPEGISEEMVQDNPMWSWWNDKAKEEGMSQEEYEDGINAYVEMIQDSQPDLEAEMEKLGENANARLDAVDAWASKSFPPEEYEAIQYSLGSSAEGIEALERIMEMTSKTNVRSEQFTQPERELTLADARSMMNDKRYFDPRYRDEAYVKKVDAAFRRLTK